MAGGLRPPVHRCPCYNLPARDAAGSTPWGYSSTGRARRSQCRGWGFESPYLHQKWSTIFDLSPSWKLREPLGPRPSRDLVLTAVRHASNPVVLRAGLHGPPSPPSLCKLKVVLAICTDSRHSERYDRARNHGSFDLAISSVSVCNGYRSATVRQDDSLPRGLSKPGICQPGSAGSAGICGDRPPRVLVAVQ